MEEVMSEKELAVEDQNAQEQNPEEEQKRDNTLSTSEIMGYLEHQYALSYEEKLQLIQHDDRYRPTEMAIDQIVGMARLYSLPLTAMAFIPSRTGGQPYIKWEGINWRLQLDPRGLKSMYAEPVQWPSKDNSYRAVFKGVVEFNNGQTFIAFGSASKESNPSSSTDDNIMRAETKSLRRAGVRAVAIPFPVFEEYVEWQDGERARKTVTQTAYSEETASRQQANPRQNEAEFTIGTLLALAVKQNLSIEDICARLGVSNLGEIKDARLAARDLGLSVEQ